MIPHRRNAPQGAQPSAAASPSTSQQTLQTENRSLDFELPPNPRYRPYGSLGSDGRYQNGGYFSGSRKRSSQSTTRGDSLASPTRASSSQQASAGPSSPIEGLTARDQQNQSTCAPNEDEDEEEDPDPAWLGACDYHTFLSVTANHKQNLTSGSTTPAQNKQQVSNSDVACRGVRIDFTFRNTNGSQSTLTGFESQSPQPSRPLRERRSEIFRNRFTSGNSSRIPRLSSQEDSTKTLKPKRSFFLRDHPQESIPDNRFVAAGRKFEALSSKISKPDLSKFVTPKKDRGDIPTSSTTPTATRRTAKTPFVRPSTTAAAHLDHRAVSLQKSSASGSLGSAGYTPSKNPHSKEISQILRVLAPQQAPLTKRPPRPPLPLKQTRSKMSDSGSDAELSQRHSAPVAPASESLPESSVTSEQVKSKGPSLRNKVSKFFGDERNSRISEISDPSVPAKTVPAYRPISLISHDSNGVSFSSEIFDEVYNAANASLQPACDSHISADMSSPSEPPSVSAPSQVVSIAISEAGRPSTLTAPGECINASAAESSRSPVDPHVAATKPDIQGTAVSTGNSSRPSSQLDNVKNETESATSRVRIAEELASRLGVSDPAAQAQILAAFTKIAPPLLHEHPAIRGDLALQVDVGLLKNKKADPASSTFLAAAGASTVPAVYPNPAAAVHVPALNVGHQGPARSARANKKAAPQSKTAASLQVPPGFTTRYLVQAHDMAKDLITPTPEDPCPAFDRTVDLTWYRYTKLLPGHRRRVHQPQLERMFGGIVTMYVAKFARGMENWAKYDQAQYKRRFRYFDLDPSIRFQIMRNLLEDYLPNKFVLLNGKRQAAPAWPTNEFASLWDVLGPLQSYLEVCPRFRAEVMVAFFMTQPFHVIFSPFVKPNTQPLPTKWLFKYAQYMQNVRVEVDLTKLGFGPTWDSTSMSTKLREIGNMVWVFAEEMEKRDPETNPMTLLTIYCRRYFGFRQGRNPFQGNLDMYRFPLIGGEEEGHGPKVNKGLPRYYGRPTTSLPPSENHPYSKHRIHHTGGPNRTPYLHEGHMSVFHPLRRLQGRVWIVRMVGLSEKWVRDHHSAWWPKEEYDAIPNEVKMDHTDRCVPTEFTYVAHNHAIYVDEGIQKGLQRIPALPSKTKRSCIYDKENDVFLEHGTANVLTIMENGVEIVPRADGRSMPRSELSATGRPDDPIELPEEEAMPPPPPAKTGATARNNVNKNRKASKVLGVAMPDDAHVPTINTAEALELASPEIRDEDDDGNHYTTVANTNVDQTDMDLDTSSVLRRKSTNGKASKVLGVALPDDSPGNSENPSTSTSPEDTDQDDLATPIQARAPSSLSAHIHQQRPPVQSRGSNNSNASSSRQVPRQMSFATEGSDCSEQNSRASSVSGRRPRALTNKKSLMSLLSRDSKKGTKSGNK